MKVLVHNKTGTTISRSVSDDVLGQVLITLDVISGKGCKLLDDNDTIQSSEKLSIETIIWFENKVSDKNDGTTVKGFAALIEVYPNESVREGIDISANELSGMINQLMKSYESSAKESDLGTSLIAKNLLRCFNQLFEEV